MDQFVDRHPYRCLPLTMANSTGWEILCPVGFTAEWNGGRPPRTSSSPPTTRIPDFQDFAKSHFSHGVLTFHPGYLFRTPRGWSMWVMGPPNHIKDGIQPLVGLVETDWLPFPFTMNWHFTRPGRVRFAKGEPFCFITLAQDKPLETFERGPAPAGGRRCRCAASTTPGAASATSSTSACRQRDPEAMKEAWQRYYFRGEMPDETGAAPKAHANKRRLKPLKLGVLSRPPRGALPTPGPSAISRPSFRSGSARSGARA